MIIIRYITYDVICYVFQSRESMHGNGMEYAWSKYNMNCEMAKIVAEIFLQIVCCNICTNCLLFIPWIRCVYIYMYSLNKMYIYLHV